MNSHSSSDPFISHGSNGSPCVKYHCDRDTFYLSQLIIAVISLEHTPIYVASLQKDQASTETSLLHNYTARKHIFWISMPLVSGLPGSQVRLRSFGNLIHSNLPQYTQLQKSTNIVGKVPPSRRVSITKLLALRKPALGMAIQAFKVDCFREDFTFYVRYPHSYTVAFSLIEDIGVSKSLSSCYKRNV